MEKAQLFEAAASMRQVRPEADRCGNASPQEIQIETQSTGADFDTRRLQTASVAMRSQRQSVRCCLQDVCS